MCEKPWFERAQRYVDLIKKRGLLREDKLHMGNFLKLSEAEKLKIWTYLTKKKIKRRR